MVRTCRALLMIRRALLLVHTWMYPYVSSKRALLTMHLALLWNVYRALLMVRTCRALLMIHRALLLVHTCLCPYVSSKRALLIIHLAIWLF